MYCTHKRCTSRTRGTTWCHPPRPRDAPKQHPSWARTNNACSTCKYHWLPHGLPRMRKNNTHLPAAAFLLFSDALAILGRLHFYYFRPFLPFLGVEENDDGVCCQLCAYHHEDVSECGTRHLNMCPSCMLLHSCHWICNCENRGFQTCQNQIVLLCCCIRMCCLMIPPSFSSGRSLMHVPALLPQCARGAKFLPMIVYMCPGGLRKLSTWCVIPLCQNNTRSCFRTLLGWGGGMIITDLPNSGCCPL